MQGTSFHRPTPNAPRTPEPQRCPPRFGRSARLMGVSLIAVPLLAGAGGTALACARPAAPAAPAATAAVQPVSHHRPPATHAPVTATDPEGSRSRAERAERRAALRDEHGARQAARAQGTAEVSREQAFQAYFAPGTTTTTPSRWPGPGSHTTTSPTSRCSPGRS